MTAPSPHAKTKLVGVEAIPDASRATGYAVEVTFDDGQVAIIPFAGRDEAQSAVDQRQFFAGLRGAPVCRVVTRDRADAPWTEVPA